MKLVVDFLKKFSRVYLKSNCSQSFQLMTLSASLLNSWNEMKIEKLYVFFLDPLPCKLAYVSIVTK